MSSSKYKQQKHASVTEVVHMTCDLYLNLLKPYDRFETRNVSTNSKLEQNDCMCLHVPSLNICK